MNVQWIDIVKLTFPFVTAILMVWIKTWIESWLTKKNKQHALSRVINDELSSASAEVRGLSHIAESAIKGRLLLVSINVSTLLSKFAYDLADLDSKQAYLYADLASSVELVNIGLSRLYSLMLSRPAASDKDLGSRLDRVIQGQAKTTATDFVSLFKVCLKVFNAIPEKNRYGDAQAFQIMEEEVRSAEDIRSKWPEIPPPPSEPAPRKPRRRGKKG